MPVSARSARLAGIEILAVPHAEAVGAITQLIVADRVKVRFHILANAGSYYSIFAKASPPPQ